MAIAASARVHASAVIDPRADLGEGVEVGPFVVIDGPVVVGDGCVLRAGAHLYGPLTLGRHNQVFDHAVLGGVPQHLKYAGEATSLQIGDHNVFREYVTVHRGTAAAGVTRVGSHNFLMASSHIGHDCQVGDRCILANGALIAGHCVLEDSVYISGHGAVHQSCRIGRLALISGLSGTSMDLPPFVLAQGVNTICGVNVIGMRRAGIATASIEAVRKAFHILFRSGLVLSASVPRLEKELGHVPEVAELAAFIRASKRGVSLQTQRDAA